MAHRDIHFRGLEKVAAGDIIKLESPDKTQKYYRILETEIISPERVPPRLAEKSPEEWLVLLTCYPFYYTGPAPKRFLVWARPI